MTRAQNYDIGAYSPQATNLSGRTAVFQALTGRQGAQLQSDSPNIKSMLIAAYGTSKRDPSRPDTAKAAKALGVTPRTVQRWIANENQQHQKPKAATFQKLATKARTIASTKRGRGQALRQAKQTYKKGARIIMTGQQGISADYARHRTVAFDFDDPELAEEMFKAYEEGGEKGFLNFISSHSDEAYGVPSWHTGTIDNISITQPYGY